MASIQSYDVHHLIGFQVGTATILRELGRGSMAIVFLAFQQTLKRQIAVKILPKVMMTARAAERFQQEAEAAAILSHPNIIPIYEVGETPEFLFMSMQLIQGRDLAREIQDIQRHPLPSRRILPLERTLAIVIQVLEALDYAHQQGIVHRDIKPANILIESHTQRPLISDFGTARFLKGDDAGKDLLQGTPLYMAPEQITGTNVDRRADVYAAGVMLFQMAAGTLPLPEYDSPMDLLKHKKDAVEGIFRQKPSALNPNLNVKMDQIIEKAVAHHPGKRFGTCAAFANALRWYQKNCLR
ncbi:MAG: serine/threonine-protein kinase [Thermodesulfobacteriota bacterium]